MQATPPKTERSCWKAGAGSLHENVSSRAPNTALSVERSDATPEEGVARPRHAFTAREAAAAAATKEVRTLAPAGTIATLWPIGGGDGDVPVAAHRRKASIVAAAVASWPASSMRPLVARGLHSRSRSSPDCMPMKSRPRRKVVDEGRVCAPIRPAKDTVAKRAS